MNLILKRRHIFLAGWTLNKYELYISKTLNGTWGSRSYVKWTINLFFMTILECCEDGLDTHLIHSYLIILVLVVSY